jgi:long-chain fatty acid transport protein
MISIISVLTVLLVAIFSVKATMAGGYSLPDITARSLGQASAMTAGIEDPSAVYFNAAGLTEVSGNAVIGSINYINSVSSVTNSGRRSINNRDDNLVSALFANYHVPGTDLTIGLGAYTPFGLATSYDEGSFTRYAAIRSELKTLYITPSIAWRVSPQLSLGGGVSFVHGSTVLSRSIFVSPLLPDARIRITDTDNAFAYNFGVLFKPQNDLKFGLAFRSRTYMKFDDADVKYKDPIGSPAKTQIARGASVPLPAMVSAGISWKATPEWDLNFTYDWTKWNDFRALTASFRTPLPVLGVPAISGLVVRQEWKNTSTLRFGTAYRPIQNLQLRGGIALDETPVPSQTLSPAIPGADILALTGGVGYTWNKLSLDISYAALFYKTKIVSNNTLEGNPALTAGRDKYNTFSNFVFIGAGYTF